MKTKTARRFLKRNAWKVARLNVVGKHTECPSFRNRVAQCVAQLCK